MGMTLDLGHKLQLAPAKAVGGPDVPRFFFQCQLGLQDNHILCPADLHGLAQQGGTVLIGAVNSRIRRVFRGEKPEASG